jgi:hypothetical protein
MANNELPGIEVKFCIQAHRLTVELEPEPMDNITNPH